MPELPTIYARPGDVRIADYGAPDWREHGPQHDQLLDTRDDALAVMDWVAGATAAGLGVGLDTESTGLDAYESGFAVRTVQPAVGKDAAVVAVNEDTVPALREMFAVLARAGHVVAHNAPYDLGILDYVGLADGDALWPRTVDTMLYGALVQHPATYKQMGQASRYALGLKDMTRALVDPEYGDDKELKSAMRKNGWDWASIPLDQPDFVKYAAADPRVTLQVLRELRTVGREEDEALYQYEARVAHLMWRLARRGQRVDPAALRAAAEEMRGIRIEAAETLSAADIDPGKLGTHDSKRRLAAIVLAATGRTLTTTDTGLPSTAAGVLEEFADAVPEVGAWQAIGHVDKYTSAYLRHFASTLQQDGRVHPSIRTLGARTGRMSISNPPLQQLPRHGGIRECLAADPGHVLIGADYSQIEMRVAAALSKDPNLLQLFRDGGDVHDEVAALLYGPDFTDEQRTIAKRAGLGRLYGAGPKAVARQCGVSVAVAKHAIYDGVDAKYPGIAKLAGALANRHEIITPFNRRIRPDPDRGYANINYMIQSTARDIFVNGILRAVAAGLEPFLWLPVHDEMIICVPEEDVEEATETLSSTLHTTFYGVECPAKAATIGANWHK